MNQEIKDDWVSALTSDEYMQGQSELRTRNDEYCCMGVLCDRAVKAGIAQWVYNNDEGWVIIPKDETLETVSPENKGTAILPRFIRVWSEIGGANPSVLFTARSNKRRHWSLASLNDSVGLDFPDIAALIKEQL